jgi:hypothetical protein
LKKRHIKKKHTPLNYGSVGRSVVVSLRTTARTSKLSI